MKLQDGYVKTGLRVPPDLHQRLHDAASAAHRTFNGEILFRLEGSFSEEVRRHEDVAHAQST